MKQQQNQLIHAQKEHLAQMKIIPWGDFTKKMFL